MANVSVDETNNAHCARLWPYRDAAGNAEGRAIAAAREAAAGARALAHLLFADTDIRNVRGEGHDVAEPFTNMVREGLHCALNACLEKVSGTLERLAEGEQRKQANNSPA